MDMAQYGWTRPDWMYLTSFIMPRRKLFTPSSMISMLKMITQGIGVFCVVCFRARRAEKLELPAYCKQVCSSMRRC
jgi:hypothetical protein